ncbi:MAG: hypothetical protein NWS87_01900 [Sediminibacterium sp.]|jgi:tetratricopeptide (TPR) repeat protein|nr:hypothetical protein [Sediminibacterium sp.]
MKKLVLLSVSVVLALSSMHAQKVPVSPFAEGVKLLNYEKNKSALAFFKEALDKNPTNTENIFWYGEAVLAEQGSGMPSDTTIKKAKAIYQQALQAAGNDPWLLVGMSHVQLLEGADVNAVKQNLEVALTTTLLTKGKFKGKPNKDIVNAIGYIHAEMPINIGDHRYAIDKLKETISAYESKVNPNLFINLGINYLKVGGENGGEAVTAFQEAITRDPNNAFPYYRIGRVYQTQSNRESFDEYYSKAIAADPTFPPVYFALYSYYADLNTQSATETAKVNLDLFLKYADKDPSLDIFNADYLFRAGQYDASLEKAKALEASIGIAALPRLGVLLAYNYDRKGDSVQAKTYIENFMSKSTADKIVTSDYELAVRIISGFSGNQVALAALLEKAIAADTARVNKLKYYKLGYEMLEKANMYSDELKWYANYSTLRGIKDEVYYYKTASIAVNAKEGATAKEISMEYITAFPDKLNGYSFNVKAAKLLDTANNLGVLFEAVTLQNQFLSKDMTKYKQAMVNNFYTMMGYYNETKAYEQAIAMCDKVLELIPGEPQTLKIKESLTKNWGIIKKMQSDSSQKAATDTTQIKKS